MSSIPLSPPASSPASVKRPIESSTTSSSSSSPSLPSASTPRKKQRTGQSPRNSALPTPSPQKNSPFPPSSLSSSIFPSTSAHKRVTFDPTLPPLSPHSPVTPKKASTSNFLYPPSASSTSPSASLPPALHSLFLLHTSLSVTLSLHLATHPPVLPPRTSFQKLQDPFGYDEEEIVLEKVANFEGASGIREVVENGAGRKFAREDLRRLAWLYEWDGQDLPSASSRSLSSLTPGPSPSPSKPSTSSTLPSLLSLSLAPTRTLSKQTRQPTTTYAFNLAVKHSAHMGGVIGAIGRWSSKQDERTKEVRRRLDRWVELCREEELEFGDEGDLPSAKVVKNIPMKLLEPLPGAAAGLGVGGRSAAVSLGNPPASTMRKSLLPGANFNSPSSSLSPGRILFPGPSTGTPPPSTSTKAASSSSSLSVTARRQALHDRIAAKASSSSSGSFLSTPAGLGDAFIDASVQKGRAGRKLMDRDELKRRSILSRLGGVAEAVFMLFTAPPSTLITPASPSSSSSGAKRRAIPLEEVASVVVKSSKVEISFAEAIQSLHLLISLCPFFLRSLNLNGEEYIEMPSSSSATLAPPSPGRQIAAMGGPASPGKVLGRGVGGLREVRERIKRELGE